MAGTITTTNTFASQTGPIPLSQLDANFTNVNTSINNLNIYSNYYADSSGSANTITVTAGSSQTVSYTAGLTLAIKVNNTNTGATTINVNSLGAKNLVTGTGTALLAGEITSGQIIVVIYDGTYFQLQGVFAGTGNFTNLTVTGTATIATLSATNDATIHGLTVGQGAGNDGFSTACGYSALGGTVTGTYNSAFGRYALGGGSISGSHNNAFGWTALGSNSSGNYNTAIGDQALQANTTANYNTAVGYQAGYSNTSSSYSTYIGGIAGQYFTGAQNTAVGVSAMQGVSGSSTGAYNTAIGTNSLIALTSGNYNTAIGNSALNANNTASYNTAVGYQAGYSNTSQSYNTFIGYQAGYNNVNNGGIVAIGYQAGYASGGTGSGTASLYVGTQAGYYTTGGGNTFVGAQASSGSPYASGYYVTTGTNNTILGAYNGNQGGLDIRTSSNYIVLSDGAGNISYVGKNVTGTYASNQAIINYVSGIGTSAESLWVIGTNSGAGSNSYGIMVYSQNSAMRFNYGLNGSVAGNISYASSSTVNYGTSSDQRLKTSLGIATDTSVIDNTVVHDFKWNADGSIDRGVFAQEAQKVKPIAVHVPADEELDANGIPRNPWQVDYSKYVPDLIVYCQQLKKTISDLEAKLKAANVAGF